MAALDITSRIDEEISEAATLALAIRKPQEGSKGLSYYIGQLGTTGSTTISTDSLLPVEGLIGRTCRIKGSRRDVCIVTSIVQKLFV